MCNLQIKVFILFQVVFFVVLFFCGQKNGVAAGTAREEIVNPHWTGKNCIECHVEDLPQWKDAKLKYDGDSVMLCNRCHGTEFARADIHPVGVSLTKEMKKISPKDWPLKDGQLTCLTCHDARIQMTDDFAVRTENPKFMRGAPFESLAEFCFTCHQQAEYKKTDPHKQLDAGGRIIESRCLFCHLSFPDSSQVKDITEVSFKSELKFYCVNCHPQEKTEHPARADHMVKLPGAMKKSLSSQITALQVDIPLDGDRIFCGTCHNPHERGVIKRKEAQHGSGEKFFLRLSAGSELCVSCHDDKRFSGTLDQQKQKKGPSWKAKMIRSTHKPMDENKCKMCHVITPENRYQPEPVFLCFKQGCHKTDLMEKKYTHEKSVVENCYLCHRPHSSVYKRLLKYPEKKLCRACHPLIRDKNGKVSGWKEGKKKRGRENTDNETFVKAEKLKKDKIHNAFIMFFKTNIYSEGNGCDFCHSPYHREKLGKTDMEICSNCHIFVHKTLSRVSAVPINIHDTFETKMCSTCHDPHSAQYNHLLMLDQGTERYRSSKPPPQLQP